MFADKHHTEIISRATCFVGGKSFGGRMSSQYLSAHPNPGRMGIVFYDFPLHPPGKPSTQRVKHLKDVEKLMLFSSEQKMN